MAQVTLKNVEKIYPGDVKAVKDFNMEVQDGEFVVLVGPSGCGKSTTLRMVAGLEEISNGTISIGDRVVNDIPPKDRDIAMVFQNYALYPHMSVYDNMAFGLKLRKFPRAEIEARIRTAAQVLGLEELLERRPKALSGGQRQRVAVGRAIVRQPAVFLFDEPLSNLDAKLRVQMRLEISQLHDKLGATMMYVTHDQVEAMTMGDRIVVMRDGIVQQVADPMTLYDDPANLFVAGFIGTPPMNFIKGHIRKIDGHMGVDTGAWRLSVPEAARPKLEAYWDRDIVLGLRPEDIGSTRAAQDPTLPRVRARVEVVEPMGAEAYVHLSSDENRFVCRVDPHLNYRSGDDVDLPVYISKARFFDPQTEARVA